MSQGVVRDAEEMARRRSRVLRFGEDREAEAEGGGEEPSSSSSSSAHVPRIRKLPPTSYPCRYLWNTFNSEQDYLDWLADGDAVEKEKSAVLEAAKSAEPTLFRGPYHPVTLSTPNSCWIYPASEDIPAPPPLSPDSESIVLSRYIHRLGNYNEERLVFDHVVRSFAAQENGMLYLWQSVLTGPVSFGTIPEDSSHFLSTVLHACRKHLRAPLPRFLEHRNLIQVQVGPSAGKIVLTESAEFLKAHFGHFVSSLWPQLHRATRVLQSLGVVFINLPPRGLVFNSDGVSTVRYASLEMATLSSRMIDVHGLFFLKGNSLTMPLWNIVPWNDHLEPAAAVPGNIIRDVYDFRDRLSQELRRRVEVFVNASPESYGMRVNGQASIDAMMSVLSELIFYDVQADFEWYSSMRVKSREVLIEELVNRFQTYGLYMNLFLVWVKAFGSFGGHEFIHSIRPYLSFRSGRLEEPPPERSMQLNAGVVVPRDSNLPTDSRSNSRLRLALDPVVAGFRQGQSSSAKRLRGIVSGVSAAAAAAAPSSESETSPSNEPPESRRRTGAGAVDTAGAAAGAVGLREAGGGLREAPADEFSLAFSDDDEEGTT